MSDILARTDEPEEPTPVVNGVTAVITPLRVLAGCAAIAMLQYAAPVLLPVVVSVLLFYALDPLVDRVEGWRVPRVVASVAVVFALLGVIGIGGTLMWPQFDAVVTKIPSGAEQLRTAFQRQRGGKPDSTIEKLQAAAKSLDSAAAEASEPTVRQGVLRVEVEQPVRVSDWMWSGGWNIVWLVGQSITILFLTIFLLNEDDSFKRKLVKQTESRGKKRVTVQVLNDIAQQMQRFIWVQAVTSGLVALATGLALWWLEVEQPAVWGVFAGIMNLVPYFGALIVTATLAAVAFLQFGTIEMAAIVSVTAFVLTSLEGMILTPLLLSRVGALNHVAIFIAIAFWSWAWGVAGMLLAVPILMAMKAVSDHVEGWTALGTFLGE